MFFALALVMLGVVSVNAQERISLQEVGFHIWDGWDGNAVKTGDAGCAWEIGVSTGQPYGDASVNNYADLTLYSKLYVTVTEGTPRVLFNRLKEEGQGGDTFEDSYLLDIPNRGWCTQKYQTIVDNVYIYDLKAIAKDYGFVHLHAIKGANWANVTVESLELETSGKAQQVGWTELTTNAGLDGDDLSSFVSKELPSVEILPSTVVDTVGVNGGHGIVVKSIAGAANDWDSQFWIVAPEALKEGTKYRVTFDYRASTEVQVETQAHSTPSNYLHYQMIGNPAFTTDWQFFEYKGKLSKEQAGNGTFQSVAFNLAINKEQDVEFYFDNLTFEVLNNGLVPQYCNQVILMDLGRPTNIPALVAATGKSRLVYPEGCAVITVGGEEYPVVSVEAFADGRFYIFVDDMLEEDVEVNVKFTNPTDPAYRIVYTDGDLSDLPDYEGLAYLNENVEVADAVPYLYAAPEVMSIDPEDGSFNLPVTFNEIKVTFDKGVNCEDLVAWLNTENLIVSPATGYAESITLTRSKTGDLAEGEYEISIEKIHSETGVDPLFWGKVAYTINVGHNIDTVEVVVDLVTALQAAVAAKDANTDEIYSGAALDKLTETIAKYDEEYKNFTAPSVFKSVAKELNNVTIEMNAHHSLVDTYYSTVNNAVTVVEQYGASKFASMPMFAQLQVDLTKYLNELQEPIKLYLDEELQAAVDALKATVDNAAKLFTEGASINNGTGTTGIAALIERLRLGAEVLKKLGVPEDDELIVAVNNALTDDDNLAEQLKYRVKLELYNALNSGKDLFAQRMDEELMEMVSDTYDMTVFFKNPNIYCNTTEVQETAFNPETTPGWTVPEGAGNPNISAGWAAPSHLITDCTFQNWGYAIGVEQTVVDLPAGIYTIKAGFGERDNAESAVGSYLYAKNSANQAEVGDTINALVIGQSFPNLNTEIKNVVVPDGVLTVGIVGSATSHIFFNNISVQISGTAENFDYKKAYDETKAAYDEYLTGIEGTEAAPAQVLGFELYDLNGRRIAKAQQGIVIMKKYMSDGTIQIEKVIKK